MDDDLQNPPEEVVKLYDHARLGGWDVVYTRYAVKQHEGWRNLGSYFANRVADQLLDKPKGLYLSSFRCMSALVVQAVSRYSGPYPYIDGLIMDITQRIDSIEVLHYPRQHGRSNYTIKRLVRLWLNLATSFSLAPLRVAVFLGAAMAAAGLIGNAEERPQNFSLLALAKLFELSDAGRLPERIAETHGGGGLALAERRGGDGRDHHVLRLRTAAQLVDRLEANLGEVVTVLLQQVLTDAHLCSDVLERRQLGRADRWRHQ